MPWKVTEVRLSKTGEEITSTSKVPASWLETAMDRGLSESEVQKRRSTFGYNELESPTENLLLKFLGFFKGPILYVIELAAVLAAGLREWIDFGVIIATLMLNAFVGWYQVKQAGDIVAQFKAGIALKTIVIREGQELEIEARELVPGDIVVVEDGKTTSCDGQLLADYDDKTMEKANEIRERMQNSKTKSHGQGEDDDEGVDKGPSIVACDQSSITGKSLAVDKFIGDTVFYITGCKRGKAYVLVTETDFCRSNGCKSYHLLEETAKEANLMPNLIKIRSSAHELGIPVIIVPHHQWTENDYTGWEFLTTSQARVKQAQLFKAGSWDAEAIQSLSQITPKATLWLLIIGTLVLSQILIWTIN